MLLRDAGQVAGRQAGQKGLGQERFQLPVLSFAFGQPSRVELPFAVARHPQLEPSQAQQVQLAWPVAVAVIVPVLIQPLLPIAAQKLVPLGFQQAVDPLLDLLEQIALERSFLVPLQGPFLLV